MLSDVQMVLRSAKQKFEGLTNNVLINFEPQFRPVGTAVELSGTFSAMDLRRVADTMDKLVKARLIDMPEKEYDLTVR